MSALCCISTCREKGQKIHAEYHPNPNQSNPYPVAAKCHTRTHIHPTLRISGLILAEPVSPTPRQPLLSTPDMPMSRVIIWAAGPMSRIDRSVVLYPVMVRLYYRDVRTLRMLSDLTALKQPYYCSSVLGRPWPESVRLEWFMQCTDICVLFPGVEWWVCVCLPLIPPDDGKGGRTWPFHAPNLASFRPHAWAETQPWPA